MKNGYIKSHDVPILDICRILVDTFSIILDIFSLIFTIYYVIFLLYKIIFFMSTNVNPVDNKMVYILQESEFNSRC